MKTSLIFILGGITTATAAQKSLTFEQSLEDILARSPVVKAADADMKATEALNTANRLIMFPTITGTISQTFSGDDTTADVANTRALGATGRLNLYKFGADRATLRGAHVAVDIKKHDRSRSILSVEERGAFAIFDLIAAEKRVNVREEEVRLQQESLRIGRQRYKRGLLAKEEVDKISIDLANSEASLRDSEIQQIQAGEKLENLLGHSRVQLKWPLLKQFRKKLPHFTPKVLSNRPDWKSAQSNVLQADLSKSNAWGQIFPSVDTVWTLGHSSALTSPGVATNSWTGAIVLSLPLFDRLNNYGTYRGRVYQLKSAEHDFETIKRTALEEFRSAQRSMKISLQTARSREKTLTVARRLFRANLKRFRQGRATANDLALDESRLLTAELLAINGWQSAHINYIHLCHAVGLTLTECTSNR